MLDPTALDLCFQGRACLYGAQTPTSMMQAQGFFERALALDPKNIEALVGMAGVHTVIGYLIMTNDRMAHLEAAEDLLTKALSMSPHHALAHSTLGAVQIALGRASQGIAECQRALELDHNLATAHALIGLAKHNLGCSAETEAHVREALRLSPRDPFLPWWMSWVGLSKLALNAYAEAAACDQIGLRLTIVSSFGEK